MPPQMRGFRILLLTSLMALSATTSIAQPEGWSAPRSINDTTLSAFWPALAVSRDGKVYAVWSCKNQPPIDLRAQLYLACFDGNRWSPAKAITDTGKADHTPEIVCDTLGNPHIVWSESESGEIYYQRFDGVSWSTPLNISGSPGASFYPRITVDHRNRIHVVWHDNSQGIYSIFYRCLDGETWSETVSLSDALYSGFPRISADAKGDLHVSFHALIAYPNYDVFYRRCRSGTWESIVQITYDSLRSVSPTISVSSADQPMIAWSQTFGDIIFPRPQRICFSIHDPNTWSSPMSLADTSECREPSMAVGSNDDVHVVWELYTRPNPFACTIYYSHKSGGSWHDAVSLMGPVRGFSIGPKVCVDTDGYCHVVWVTDDHRVCYTRQTTVSDVSDPEGLPPLILSLEQNYPNPFNSQTVIEYSIPKSGRTTVKLFDVLGRELRSLWAGEQDQGMHSITVDASGLPSGVYFYRLQSTGGVHTRSMLLLR
jgi:hypothetical protein